MDNEPPRLSTGQVSELKKVFAMLNQSGTRKLSLQELSIALEKITGQTPSMEEVQRAMSQLDQNNDGMVDFTEFTSVLSAYINHDNSSDQLHSDEFDKKQLHSKVVDFFGSFKANWSQLQQRRLEIATATQSSLTEQEILNQNQRAEAVQKLHKMYKQLPSMCSKLQQSVIANDISKTTECVQFMADTLSILKLYEKPDDRLQIAGILASVFRTLRDANCSKRIINFIRTETHSPELQLQSLRYLCYYCQGPRIPNTPEHSTLNPNRMYHKSVCINNGAVDAVEPLFSSKDVRLRNKAIEAVGKIASHDEKARTYVIQTGIGDKLIELLHPEMNLSTLRCATWTISIFLGNTHTHTQTQIPENVLIAIMKKLGTLLFRIIDAFKKDIAQRRAATLSSNSNNKDILNDVQRRELQSVLMNVLCCLSFLTPGMKIDDKLFWRNFVELVSFPVDNVQLTVCETIRDIVRADESQLENLLSSGVLKVLHTPLVSKNKGCKHMALGVLTVIVRSKQHAAQLIKSGYVEPLLKLMKNDDLCRLTIVKVLRSITRDVDICRQLVSNNKIIGELTHSLQSFKTYDPLIKEVYHYVGPTYNFEFVADVLVTLEHILDCGKTSDGGNAFIDQFDMEMLDRIGDVMVKISISKGIETWRMDSADDVSLEERLVNLLNKIKFSHLQCNSVLSNEVRLTVDDLILKFRKGVTENAFSAQNPISDWSSGMNPLQRQNSSVADFMAMEMDQKLQIRAHLNNETTQFEIDRDIRFENLLFRLSQMSGGGAIQIQAKLPNGNMELIGCQMHLDGAISQCANNQLELFLESLNLNGQSNSNSLPVSPQKSNSPLFEFAHKVEQLGLSESMNKVILRFRAETKDGQISKQSFIDVMKEEFQSMNFEELSLLYQAFDFNNDGTLNCEEICCGLAILYRGSKEERIRLAFKAGDVSGNDKLCPMELFHVFKSLAVAQGIPHDTKLVDKWVKESFRKYDREGKRYLTFHEFYQMVHRKPMMIKAFLEFNG